MKSEIEGIIKKYVEQYPEIKNVQTRWYEPLIFYADANDEMFNILKEAVSKTHALPKDLMPDGQTVVAYFLPFDVSVVRSNIEERECSKIWATAYIETNQLIWDLNNHIKSGLEKSGYKSNIIPATHNFNEEKLMSDWSHRHVAYVAGMGTFGINNMLITDKGCCGRIGTFITDMKLKPTERKNSENCLYKHSNICRKCIGRCVNDALTDRGFDRFKCYEMCLYNDSFHSDIEGIADVCGKCLVYVPCSTRNPIKITAEYV